MEKLNQNLAETNSRLSTNLESWLHEIADEDERGQSTWLRGRFQRTSLG